MDKVVEKWFVCLATLVVAVLLSVSLYKLNKKKSKNNGSAEGKKAKNNGGNAPAPFYSCPAPVEKQPLPYKGAPSNCMADDGVNLFGKPCCTKSEYGNPMQVFARRDGACICLAPGDPDCNQDICDDACATGDEGQDDKDCYSKCKSICGF